MEHDTCGDVPDAPRLDLEVGGLEEHRQAGLVDDWTAVEECRERVEARGQLLPAEEEKRNVHRTGIGRGEVAHQLDRNGEAALHVACPAADDPAVFDAPWNVVLGRDGVVVARQHQQRRVRTSLPRPEKRLVAGVNLVEGHRNRSAQPLADLRLVEALGGNVDELERSLGKSIGETVHPASLPPPRRCLLRRRGCGAEGDAFRDLPPPKAGDPSGGIPLGGIRSRTNTSAYFAR